MLVAARALQGAFGAILAPSALGTLVSTFTDPRERGRAFGVFGSVAAGGGGLGLILGGVLTQYLSWRWTLYINLVFAAIAIVGAVAYMRDSRPTVRPRMDWPGAVLACAGLFLIVFGCSHAETAGWTAGLTIGSLVLGVVLLAAFAVAERRGSHPLLPLHVLLDRTRGGSYVAVGLAGIAIFGVFLFLTYYLQVVKGYSPVTSGLSFLPMIGCILLSSTVSSIVTLPRLGPRVLITTGMVLGAGAMTYLTRLTVTSSYAADVLPALLIMGVGFGMIISPAINTATAGVRRQDSGVASALVNTMQQVGGSIGTSALSTIALTATTSYLAAHHAGPLAPAIAATHGYTTAFAVSAGIFGLGVILAIVLLPSRPRLAALRAEATAQAGVPTLVPAATPMPVAAHAAAGAAADGLGPQPDVHGLHAIPVAIVCCSPVINPASLPASGPEQARSTGRASLSPYVGGGVAGDRAAGAAVSGYGEISGDRDSPHHPRQIAVVVDRVVLGGAVVPYRQVTGCPAPADRVLEPGHVLLEQREQMLAVGGGHAEDPLDELAEQQRPLPRLRMYPDHRVLGLVDGGQEDLPVVAVIPVGLGDVVTLGVVVGVGVQRPQAVGERAQFRRQRRVRGGRVRP
jgi:MFS family permease